jgi:oligopeptide/dipeptide ABC transporter ATP-binding protein
MYLGKIVELGGRNELFIQPLHPYTQSLISAVPVPDPEAEEKRKPIILKGEVPSPTDPPSGCVFNTRCPIAIDVCSKIDPDYREVLPDHYVACHLVSDDVEPAIFNDIEASPPNLMPVDRRLGNEKS